MKWLPIAAFMLATSPALPAPAQPSQPAAAAAHWGLDRTDLGTLTADGLLAKAGLPARFAEARAAAEGGDAIAAILVAVAYLNGIGVAADPAEGRRWAERAAAAGEARALYTLGMIRAHGAGMPVDLPAALAWLERAHRAGIALAAADMGSLLYNGEGGVAQDRARAVSLLREAAAAGVARANGGLALAYFNGDGAARDHAAAREAAWRGAEARDPLSQNILAAIHGLGLGVERDPGRARGWQETAALDGSPEALERLGWTEATLALVRRWGPYARLTNRRLSRGPHVFHYRWREPGRVLELEYGNFDDRGVIDVVFTWPEGAEAPVSDHPEWTMLMVDGELFERAPLGMLLRFNVDRPLAMLSEFEAGPDGRPGALRRLDPVPSITPAQHRALHDAAFARPRSASEQTPAQD